MENLSSYRHTGRESYTTALKKKAYVRLFKVLHHTPDMLIRALENFLLPVSGADVEQNVDQVGGSPQILPHGLTRPRQLKAIFSMNLLMHLSLLLESRNQ